MNTPKPGIYRHYKGNLYQVIAVANHSETLEEVVIYRALYGEREYWVRPLSMWNDIVEVDGHQIPRFVYIKDSEK